MEEKESTYALADKIKNIDGTGMREGSLLQSLRNIPLPKSGSFITNKDGSLRPCNESGPSGNVESGNNAGKSVQDATFKTGKSVPQHGIKTTTGNSFASVLQTKPLKKVVKIKELRNEEKVQGAAVAIPYEAVEEISSRFSNTLYGFFIGKRLAFPLVENYVKNTWAKYGLKRIQLHDDFFLFQFESKEGMDRVLEDGPWLIRTVPLILNVWSPNTDLKKAEVKKAPFLEKSTYARALIEVSAEKDLLDSLVIAIPVDKDKGHTLATIDIEYEWNPPRCSTCMIFDHHTDKCPKLLKEKEQEKPDVNEDAEGFVEVKKKKQKNKSRQQKVAGIRLTKPQPQLQYRRVDKGETSQKVQKNKSPILVPELSVTNSFGPLDENEDEGYKDISHLKHDDVLNFSDDEVDEEFLVGRDGTDWTSNGSWCTKGTRIIMGWNRNDVDVVVINHDDQVIHSRIWLKSEKKELFCSFVYAHNKYVQQGLNASGANVWMLLAGISWSAACVNEIEVMDVQRTGLQFTWNQKPKGINGLMKKLDRIMANVDFHDHFVGAHAIFKPYRVSDHSPAVLCIPTTCKVKPKPFKFFNVLTSHENFLDVVKEGWNQYISGFHMYRVVRKLKSLKKPFRKLLYEKGNLHANVTRLRADLDSIQTALDADPFNVSLRETEAACVVEFNQAVLMEERFLKQKAKVQWLKEGDSNSAYFHKAVKSRVTRSRIDVITNSEGVVFKNSLVPEAFVSHYELFLGYAGVTGLFNSDNLFQSCLNEQEALDMTHDISIQEVKDAMFSMGDDKSPGSDGYTATNGTLLKEINHTIIALIPKVKSLTRINDYRPISCCNVLFKCISKIIANRIKHCLKNIASPNQSAFVPGGSITDNILLTQELMHNYHLDRGTPRCAFKVDIQKAYDTVDWEFLRTILHGFGFHDKMVSWIIECVSTTSYSICVNGSLHGYFKGKRGLRQGDPLSPYLFTLVMEVITLMIQRRIRETDYFTYHRYCSKMELVNLCFADDLFLFAYGDVNSASIIKEVLDEFKVASGLRIRDCNELVDRVQLRIQDWKNKSLSIAGRLQLIQSVLGSMHIYWASVFMLPTNVLHNIEQLMRQFLWSNGSSGKSKSKVAWEVVCLPKNEGGLGIRRLECFNSALMTSHVWKLLTLKESLWVKWIHEYKLKGRNFWDIPLRGNMSWGWRKILKLRPIVRNFIWKKIGNGMNTSLWYDKWNEFDPLANRISPRDIHRAGLNLQSKVSDVIFQGTWIWPPNLLVKYPFLIDYNIPIRDDVLDCLEWRNHHGIPKKFTVSQVWIDIRYRDSKVSWYNMVWFPYCIPGHAFNLWLIVRKKLTTQDLIPVWDRLASLGTVCSLCESIPDSHEHLFFECSFAHGRTMKSVVAKIVVAATVYFIWLERNWRLFKKGNRTNDQIVDCIKTSVRLKLLSCKLKKSKNGERMARLWELPEAVFI
ncbi:hypothetical protein Tco_0810552 [Tanacetum coccineum]